MSQCHSSSNGKADLRGDAKLVLLERKLFPICSVFTHDLCLISGFLGSPVGPALWSLAVTFQMCPHIPSSEKKKSKRHVILPLRFSFSSSRSKPCVCSLYRCTHLANVSILNVSSVTPLIKEGENFLTSVRRSDRSDRAVYVPLVLIRWLPGPRIQAGCSLQLESSLVA